MNKNLEGKIFCLSGRLVNGKSFWQNLIKDNGGKIKGGISKTVDFLIAGPGSGQKTEFAKKNNIPILDEEKLIRMIKEGIEIEKAIKEVSRFKLLDI